MGCDTCTPFCTHTIHMSTHMCCDTCTPLCTHTINMSIHMCCVTCTPFYIYFIYMPTHMCCDTCTPFCTHTLHMYTLLHTYHTHIHTHVLWHIYTLLHTFRIHVHTQSRCGRKKINERKREKYHMTWCSLPSRRLLDISVYHEKLFWGHQPGAKILLCQFSQNLIFHVKNLYYCYVFTHYKNNRLFKSKQKLHKIQTSKIKHKVSF